MAPENPDGAAVAPLSEMEKLSSTVLVYRPAVASTPVPAAGGLAPPPKLVLVAAWMDARDLHIAKYVAKYRALYPAAQILLVKCTMVSIRYPVKALTELEPAVPVLHAAFPSVAATSSSTAPPELLIHAFSNGGSITLKHLYALYRDSSSPASTSTSLPPHRTILDSAPGHFSYRRSLNFLLAGRPRWMRIAFAPFIHALTAWWWFMTHVVTRRDPLLEAGNVHNDRSAGAGNARESGRVYIYSETDNLVDPRGVEANAAGAKAAGFERVRLENFGDSPHVAHARTDEARYWGIVKGLWEKGE